ncbi:MAG: dihydroneopterin aldolase [Deltaproteobacteria bacterium]|nr:dihydroneopterin aldolase [Deltaproteobacteria bacterium]
MDRILIKGLRARCVIGVGEEERLEKQDVMIDIALFADLEKPGKSDRFEETIDYRSLKKRILAMAEASAFHLIEAMAESIAAICLEHPLVAEAQVRVCKPLALRFARNVGVEITRRRAG